MSAISLAALIQSFFTDRLCAQLEASSNTVTSYRDTFRLFLGFASEETGKQPINLCMEDLHADMVGSFLIHLENVRGNSARSRNARLSAIRSFFRFVAITEPAYMQQCQRILSMPNKRYIKRTIDFLTCEEMNALLSAPDRSSWIGQRDHAILALALQTGLRASELVNLRRRDFVTGVGAHVCCIGKGRKQRCTPVGKEVHKVLSSWVKANAGADSDPLFPTIRGGKLSRDALERIVKKYTQMASKSCPSIANKKISPHVLRHSTAMNLLSHGVDQTVIALWLGHESVETTQIYVHADLALKEKALAKMLAPTTKPGRFQPDDELLAYLEGL